jgi:hypothetical protein
MPPAVNQSNAKHYRHAKSPTDYKEFEGRSHYSVIGGEGWRRLQTTRLSGPRRTLWLARGPKRSQQAMHPISLKVNYPKFAPRVFRWHHTRGGKGGPPSSSKSGSERRLCGMQPTRVLPAVSVLSLIGVEYGGWALLGFLTGRGQLGQFREQFFRAGHAHAGVLLVLSLVYFLHLDRTGYSDGVKWVAGSLLLAGIMAQSGGFFIHLGLGRPNRSSLGTVVTRLGAVLIAAALIILAVGLLRSGR